MLHDDQRVPGVFKVFHDRVDAIHVAGVQADRRFIQHEERIDEVSAEGGRQVDALHFAPGKRPALPIQREVPESHVLHQLQRLHNGCLRTEKFDRLIH